MASRPHPIHTSARNDFRSSSCSTIAGLSFLMATCLGSASLLAGLYVQSSTTAKAPSPTGE